MHTEKKTKKKKDGKGNFEDSFVAIEQRANANEMQTAGGEKVVFETGS